LDEKEKNQDFLQVFTKKMFYFLKAIQLKIQNFLQVLLTFFIFILANKEKYKIFFKYRQKVFNY